MPHQIALYAVDYDGGSRTERIEVLDAVTGAVLDTRTRTSCGGGQYVVWTISGHVIVRVTRMAGINSVASAIFID